MAKKAEVKVSCQADFARAAALSAAETVLSFFPTRSLPGGPKASAGRTSKPQLILLQLFRASESLKHNFGRSTWRAAGKALLSFRYFFLFTERKCVRKVCGLKPEACKVQITTPDKCSYKLKQK